MIVELQSKEGQCEDFTNLLPVTLSENIFTLLDVYSLCSASQVSRRWHSIISDSDYIWQAMYMNIKGHTNMISDLSYKTMVARQYALLQRKAKWLAGKFSFVSSFKDLEKTESSCKFSKKDWGDILQEELQR